MTTGPITDDQILALRAEYLADRNISGVDTCDVALGRHGASRSPRRVARARARCAEILGRRVGAAQAHAEKKSAKQLDTEIAEALATAPQPSRPSGPSVVYLQTRSGQNHELSGRRLTKLRKDFAADRGGPALANFAASGYIGFIGPDGELWDLEALPSYLLGGAR